MKGVKITGEIPTEYTIKVWGGEVTVSNKELAKMLTDPSMTETMMNYPEILGQLIDCRAELKRVKALREDTMKKEQAKFYLMFKNMDSTVLVQGTKEGPPTETVVKACIDQDKQITGLRDLHREAEHQLELLEGTILLMERIWEGMRSLNANERRL